MQVQMKRAGEDREKENKDRLTNHGLLYQDTFFLISFSWSLGVCVGRVHREYCGVAGNKD
jgi:hypothetical protein